MTKEERQKKKQTIDKDIPIVYGYISEHSFYFNCPFCDEIHSHGWTTPEENELTHRTSHCKNSNSPFNSTGYYISIHADYDI